MSSEAVPVTPVTCQVLDSICSGLRDLHVACTVKRFTDVPGSRSHVTSGSRMCLMLLKYHYSTSQKSVNFAGIQSNMLDMQLVPSCQRRSVFTSWDFWPPEWA